MFRLGTENSVLMIKFMVSAWCNYDCPYCNYSRSTRKRNDKFHTGLRSIKKILFSKNRGHAFDNYQVETWVEAFNNIKPDFIVSISGGEPFLDTENFPLFLESLAKMDKCKLIRIDTNGFWGKIGKYRGINDSVRQKTVLNVSYHPTQINWERYTENIRAICESGWSIAMINYVMTDEQKSGYKKFRDFFMSRYGVYVNPNPDRYGDKNILAEELKKYFPEIDMKYKVIRANPAGIKCYHPSICFYLQPTGEISRNCTDFKAINFLKKSRLLTALKEPMVCKAHKCPCPDMYAFQADSGRGKSFNLLGEFVEECRKHQEKFAGNKF